MRDNMQRAQIFHVWAYHGDGGERGTGPVVGYRSSECAAREAGKHTGFYGGQGYVSKVPAIKIEGEVYILANEKPIDLDGVRAQSDAELKRKTIESLTPEQIRVLGL